jgi:putative tryptophan/tyrosine transport system ATP-binding protein
MTGVVLDSVSKRFRGPGGTVTALNDVSLEVPSGQFVVLVGHNGSGKSTFLKLLAGRDEADTGKIVIDPVAVDPAISDSSTVSTFVAQDPRRGTADDLTVAEHLELARLRRIPRPFGRAVRGGQQAEAARQPRARALQSRVQAEAETLSGGERQLLALEMAAATGTKLFLLDEPTASLDRSNANYCLAEIERMSAELGATIFLVTHDLFAAARMGDRLLVLVDGRISCDMSKESKGALTAEDILRLVDSGEAKGAP